MRKILYNPVIKKHKMPIGAVRNSDDILITIKITKQYNVYDLRIVVKRDDSSIVVCEPLIYKESSDLYLVYEIVLRIKEAGLYWYYFMFNDIYGKHYIGANHELDAYLTDLKPHPWQLSIFEGFRGNLNWFKGNIMYQIMVDRFYRGRNTPIKPGIVLHDNWLDIPEYRPVNGKILNNDFYGGNISGIIEKLDYLKTLSVGIIYLNPIFEAASNHKYDTGDYLKIDPMFGTEADFIDLCKEARLRNIAIVLDGVFNHTGDDSIYFNKYGSYSSLGASQSVNSPYYNWYKFISHPHDYESWWGIKTLPNVNQNSKEFMAFITGPDGVITKWLKLGAAGFRLDVIDELNDKFLEKIYSAVKKVDEENIVIGEVWEDASNKTSYGRRRRYLCGYEVDSVMNYPLKNAIIGFIGHNNLVGLKIQMRRLINNYPKQTIHTLMNHLGTHDTLRLLNNFAVSSPDHLSKDQQAHYRLRDQEYENAVILLKLAVVLQYTLPGVPSVYYGDETGSQGFRDPFCRNTLNWEDIDSEVYDWYCRLGKIRSDVVYKEGEYQEEYIEKGVFSFSRLGESYKIITIINNNNFNVVFNISGLELLYVQDIHETLFMPPKSAAIIRTDVTEKLSH